MIYRNSLKKKKKKIEKASEMCTVWLKLMMAILGIFLRSGKKLTKVLNQITI
jgi:hypothetical protein